MTEEGKGEREKGRGRKREEKYGDGVTIRKYAGSPCYLRYTMITACPFSLRVLNVSPSPHRFGDRQSLIRIATKVRQYLLRGGNIPENIYIS